MGSDDDDVINELNAQVETLVRLLGDTDADQAAEFHRVSGLK